MFRKACFSFVAVLAYFLQPVLSTISSNFPVCPAKYTDEYNYPYVLYGKQARCYVASRQGPCPKNSILFARPKSAYGVCSCECFLDEGIVFDDARVRDYRYCLNARMGQTFVFDKKRCACYQLNTQGPCSQGQVYVKEIYDEKPTCKEDVSSQPHTERCPPGTIYSDLLNICTDMSFTGLPKTSTSTTTPGSTSSAVTGRCPPGTIYSELLNICTDMSFTGLPKTSPSPTQGSTAVTGRCPPGTIYSDLLNICTDMSFTGLPKGSSTPATTGVTGKCPPGTIYSTLLNICTDMNFTGLPKGNGGTPPPSYRKCPEGTIYSTLLNKCTDMNFRGLARKHWQ